MISLKILFPNTVLSPLQLITITEYRAKTAKEKVPWSNGQSKPDLTSKHPIPGNSIEGA